MSGVRGRRIAFDYGSVRIGVAICDPDGILATPLPYIPNVPGRRAKDISKLFDEYQPIAIYIGYPKHLSGTHGAATDSVDAFIEELSAITTLSVERVDERFTTVSAAQRLREAGKNSKESKELIDSMAAVEILESALRR